jgi:hypothetical protein
MHGPLVFNNRCRAQFPLQIPPTSPQTSAQLGYVQRILSSFRPVKQGSRLSMFEGGKASGVRVLVPLGEVVEVMWRWRYWLQCDLSRLLYSRFPSQMAKVPCPQIISSFNPVQSTKRIPRIFLPIICHSHGEEPDEKFLFAGSVTLEPLSLTQEAATAALPCQETEVPAEIYRSFLSVTSQ